MNRLKRKYDYDGYYDPRSHTLRNAFDDVDVRLLVERNAELEDQLRQLSDTSLDPQLMREQIADLRQEKERLQKAVSVLDAKAASLHMLEETIKGLQRSIAKLQSDNLNCYNELRSLKLSLLH